MVNVLEWVGYALIIVGIIYGLVGQKFVKLRWFVFKDRSMIRQYLIGLILTLLGIGCLYIVGLI